MMDGKTFNKLRPGCPYYKFISPGPAMAKAHLCFMSVGKNDGAWQAKPCSFKKCGFMYWRTK